jgi:hypothetical protein
MHFDTRRAQTGRFSIEWLRSPISPVRVPTAPLSPWTTTSSGRVVKAAACCWLAPLAGVNGVDDLGAVDALQVDRGDAEVGVSELALDDDQRDALAGHLDGVGVA